MIKRKKRGQFYLVAALVIISIIVGLAVVSNYARAPKVTVYDLGEELKIEGGYVLDYGTSMEPDMASFMGNFTELYASYIEEGRNIYFIYGNEEGIYIFNSTIVDTGGIFVEDAGVKVTGRDRGTRKILSTDPIEITVGEITYTFNLQIGENFWFIIAEGIGEEIYIVS